MLGSSRLRLMSQRAGRKDRRAPSTSLNLKIGLATPSLAKIWPVCQTNWPQAQIAPSSPKNAISFSSACTTKRFPLSRRTSATKIAQAVGIISALGS